MRIGRHVAVPCLTLIRPATAEVVGDARSAVSAFAEANGASDETLIAIAMAVSEAVANVVVHAYAGVPGEVRVDADVEDDELELVVSDDGRGFMPGSAPGLGLGLGLIRACAAAFEIRDRPLGGVEVWMRFPLEA